MTTPAGCSASNIRPIPPRTSATPGISSAGGNYGVGRLTQITDASGFHQLDLTMRLAELRRNRRPPLALSYTIGYNCVIHFSCNVTQITYPSGRVVTYSRDALGRITGVTTQQSASKPRRLRSRRPLRTCRSFPSARSPMATAQSSPRRLLRITRSARFSFRTRPPRTWWSAVPIRSAMASTSPESPTT